MRKNYLKKILTLSLVALIFITGCGKKGSSVGSEKLTIDAKDGIEAKAYLSYDETEIILYATNNSDKDIGSVSINLDYFDSNNKNIGNDTTAITNFKRKSTNIVTVGLPLDDDLNFYVPANIKVSLSVDQEYQEELGYTEQNIDKFAGTATRNNDEVNVVIVNNNGRNFDEVIASVVYKKGDVPIAVTPFVVNDIESRYEDVLDIPTKWNKETREDELIDFDTIEVIITDATESFDALDGE